MNSKLVVPANSGAIRCVIPQNPHITEIEHPEDKDQCGRVDDGMKRVLPTAQALGSQCLYTPKSTVCSSITWITDLLTLTCLNVYVVKKVVTDQHR